MKKIIRIKKILKAIMLLRDDYKKIHTISELQELPKHVIPNCKKVHHVDLSELDLSEYLNMFVGKLPDNFMSEQDAANNNILLDWSDDVIWPPSNKMPNGIDPQKILEDSKQSVEVTALHKKGLTGQGINIAIIDQRLNTTHPEYKNNIKHYQVFGPWDKRGTDYHGSLVSGIAVGKTTGVAPDANLYYFAAPVSEKLQDGTYKLSRKYAIEAIKEIIRFNKSHPESEKIRFLSCSWGTKQDLYYDKCEELFKECEKNGIKILGGTHSEPTFRPYDPRYDNDSEFIGIPTNGKTTSFWQGGFKYTRLGGMSSTFPYLAGVYACALQGNQIFFTRPNWQTELDTIMQDTATESPHGGKIINPVGIRERVTKIAHEMEMNLIKQKSNEYE